MSKKKRYPKHMYVGILRCRSYYNWPLETRVVSDTLSTKLNGQQIYFTLQFVSYNFLQGNKKETPQTELGPIIARETISPDFFRLGRYLVKSPEDISEISIKYGGAYPGEVDIQCHIGCDTELPIESLDSEVSPVLYSLLGTLSIATKDILIPVAPAQYSKINHDGKRELLWNELMYVHERKTHEVTVLRELLEKYIDVRATMTPEEGRAFDTAARRIVSSKNEKDLIDRYCDLWEACEFLLIGFNAKGDIVSRIAQAIACYTGGNKAKIENGLELRNIYKVRKEVVHEALQDEQRVDTYIKLLDEIANQLFKWRLKISYANSKIIDPYLD